MTAILTGSTRQISPFGADQTDRNRIGNDADNGYVRGCHRLLTT
jgi:hypothetical protein